MVYVSILLFNVLISEKKNILISFQLLDITGIPKAYMKLMETSIFLGGFPKWGYPQIIHFRWGLSIIDHLFWGYPHVSKPPIYFHMFFYQSQLPVAFRNQSSPKLLRHSIHFFSSWSWSEGNGCSTTVNPTQNVAFHRVNHVGTYQKCKKTTYLTMKCHTKKNKTWLGCIYQNHV